MEIEPATAALSYCHLKARVRLSEVVRILCLVPYRVPEKKNAPFSVCSDRFVRNYRGIKWSASTIASNGIQTSWYIMSCSSGAHSWMFRKISTSTMDMMSSVRSLLE